MSTEAAFDDETIFAQCIGCVRSDTSEDRYVVVGHKDGNPNIVTLLQSGDNVDDIGALMDDMNVMYVLARYESTFDMSTTIKFVYFRWIGEKVPYVKRGRFGVVHGSVEQYFQPYHLCIETSAVDDFNKDKILLQLEENTGKKSKVLDSVDGCQERGFTQTQLPKRGPRTHTGPTVSKDSANVEISDEVLVNLAEVRSDSCETRWVLCEYRDKGFVDSVAKGEGDVDELATHLADDKVMYGSYRVTDTVDDITTVKFVFIQWVGPKVKPMMKAKISTYKGTMEATFSPFHITIFAVDHSDISESIIMDKVTSASGTKSHVK